jgi:Tfp pilus assembly protein PilP
MWLTLLATKDEASDAIKQFMAEVEREAERKVRTLRTDRGGDFSSNKLNRYCEQLGV